MSKNLIGIGAVEVMGYYASGFLTEYQKLLKRPNMEEKIDHVLNLYEFPNPERLKMLIAGGSSDEELWDINLLRSLAEALIIWGTRLSHFNTSLKYKAEWFDGGEDAGFYLGQIGYTFKSFVELLDELDPVGVYTQEYIDTFVQVF